MGIAENTNSYKTSLPNIINSKHKKTETIQEQDNENDDDQSSKLGVSKVVRFDSDHHDYNHDQKYICNVEDTIIETLLPIPYADEDVITEIKQPETPIKENNEKLSSAAVESPKPNPRMIYDNNSNSLVEAINTIVINREVVKRGRLDKSYSTPTYDPTETGKIFKLETYICNFFKIILLFLLQKIIYHQQQRLIFHLDNKQSKFRQYRPDNHQD